MNDNDAVAMANRHAHEARRKLRNFDPEDALVSLQKGATAIASAPPDIRWKYHIDAGVMLLGYTDHNANALAVTAAKCYLEKALIDAASEDAAALTQNHFGRALVALGRQENNVEHYCEARSSFLKALQVWTRNNSAASWARAKINLATSLNAIFGYEDDKTLMHETIGHLHETLDYLAVGALPDWPRAQNALGHALANLNQHEDAIPAYNKALEYSRDPNDIVRIQANVAWSQIALKNFDGAIAPLETSLSIYGQKINQRLRGTSLSALGQAYYQKGVNLWENGDGSNGIDGVIKAASIFENALRYLPRQIDPDNWAAINGALANAYLVLAGGAGGPLGPKLQLADKAMTILEEILPETNGKVQEKIHNNLTVARELRQTLMTPKPSKSLTHN